MLYVDSDDPSKLAIFLFAHVGRHNHGFILTCGSSFQQPIKCLFGTSGILFTGTISNPYLKGHPV